MSVERSIKERFTQLNCCVIVPTYNNRLTIAKIIEDVLEYTSNLIVVNDGSTDDTATILEKYTERALVIGYEQNRGKGFALRTAFKAALEKGYRYAITIDSDGQHYPSDFVLFLDAIEKSPDSFIIGSRNLNQENVPKKNSFGNKFSNFWYTVATGIKLHDTQTGFRLYPIQKLKKMHFFSTKYEFELEVLVKAAWKRINIIPIAINVYYPKPEERVTHFRPGKDFFRISILNTYLVTLAFLWYRPLRFLRMCTITNIKQFFVDHFFNPEESPFRKSASVAVGFFFGIVPIWGYQLISAIAAAYILKLNKPVVIATANISVPPMIPLILFASFKTGELVTGQEVHLAISDISLETIKSNVYVYAVGAVWLSVVFSLFMGMITFFLTSMIRKIRRTGN